MSSARRCGTNTSTSSSSSTSSSPGRSSASPLELSPGDESKQSSSLYALRGKSWSCFQKIITNILGNVNDILCVQLRWMSNRCVIFNVAPKQLRILNYRHLIIELMCNGSISKTMVFMVCRPAIRAQWWYVINVIM